MSELRPCPFCGCEVEFNERGKVQCVGACIGIDAEGYMNEWNTRPIEDPLRARVEALEAAMRSGVWTDCEECGLLVDVDEDGCCVTCGADAMCYSDGARAEALEAENERLRDYRDRIGEQLLEWRGIDQLDACKTCGGSGVRSYLNTTTWMGGIGGQMITNDVCDKCWGSGSASRPGYDLRKAMRRDAENERLRRAVEIVRENEWMVHKVYDQDPVTGEKLDHQCTVCFMEGSKEKHEHADNCWLVRALRVAKGGEDEY